MWTINLYTVTYNIEEPMNSRLVFVISTHVCWLYQHFSCELHQMSLRHLRLGSSGWNSMNFPCKTLNNDALFFCIFRKMMSRPWDFGATFGLVKHPVWMDRSPIFHTSSYFFRLRPQSVGCRLHAEPEDLKKTGFGTNPSQHYIYIILYIIYIIYNIY